MDKKDILKILNSLRQLLEQRNIHVDQLILFGSWAKGTQQEGSDIDVVIISENFYGKDYWTRINILSEAIYQVFAPIQATAMTLQEWESKESPICDFAQKGEVITV